MQIDREDNINKAVVKGKKIDILGFLMVIIPLVSSILIWLWYRYFFQDVIKDISLYLIIVLLSTILLTSIIATIDSHRLGFIVSIIQKKNITGGKFLNFFVFLLLWVYAYPAFLMRRKKHGSRNLFIPLLFSLIIFIGSFIYIYRASELKKADDVFQKRIERMRRN